MNNDDELEEVKKNSSEINIPFIDQKDIKQNDSDVVLNNSILDKSIQQPQQQSFFQRISKKFTREIDWHQSSMRSIIPYKQHNAFSNNKIVTSKYTIFTFLPLNLYGQFTKLANVYFLIFGILEMIPEITTSDGLPVIYLPLFVIVVLTMIKDIYEDYQRHQSDFRENNMQIQQLVSQDYQQQVQYKNTKSQDLIVGDLIKINNNEQIPADIILLYTDNNNNNCYVKTVNLDGETNLKIKTIPLELQKFIKSEKDCFHQNFKNNIILNYQGPNPIINQFEGSISLREQNQQDYDLLNNPQYKLISLNIDNLLLRGCQLKNTEFIIGLVVYTGHESKIMLNSNNPRLKKSKLEQIMNKYTIIMVILLIFTCLICSGFNALWYSEQKFNINSYLDIPQNSIFNKGFQNFLLQFFTWIMIFMNLLPISLLITIEFIRLMQAICIKRDKKMFSLLEKQNNGAQVQSSNLNEELGQINCIFTDKTGTLTKNKMKFKCLWVPGLNYDVDYQNIQNNDEDNKKNNQNSQSSQSQESSKIREGTIDINDTNCLDYQTLQNQLAQNGLQNILKDSSHIFYQKIYQALLILSSCHSIIKNEQTGEYNAASPDELAFVQFTETTGFQFQGVFRKQIDNQEKECLIILINNKEEVFFVEQLLEFTQDRRRMSIILRNSSTKEILLFTKGADSSMLPRINGPLYGADQLINSYAEKGLRTLVLAQKQLSEEELQFIQQQLLQSLNTFVDRQEKLNYIYDSIENNLELVGVTGIEDELQNNVYDTILSLKKEANIAFWMLTGDKLETAINIGYTTGIIDKTNQISIIPNTHFDIQSIDNHLNNIIENNQLQQKQSSLSDSLIIQNQQQQQYMKDLIQKNSLQNKKLTLVIQGDCLCYIKENKKSLELFEKVLRITESVIACRVSPNQKKQIVEIYQNLYPKNHTLAIGDGANDVSMIIAAHVGIGIRGFEGMQAARASDFSICEFQFIKRLMLIHGRECYRRNSDAVLYNFYKNIVYLNPQFWIGIYTGFSGVFIYDVYLFQLFNCVYTALPIIFYSVFDKEFSYKMFAKYPKLYQLGQKNLQFNGLKLFQWLILGWVQTLFISIISQQSMYTIDNQGQISDTVLVGQIIYVQVIFIVNLEIIIMHHTQMLLTILIIIISTALYFVSLLILSLFNNNDLFNISYRMFKQPYFYLVILLTMVICIILEKLILNFNSNKQYLIQSNNSNNTFSRYKQENKKENNNFLSINFHPQIKQ